jgi:hypothetical protein
MSLRNLLSELDSEGDDPVWRSKVDELEIRIEALVKPTEAPEKLLKSSKLNQIDSDNLKLRYNHVII